MKEELSGATQSIARCFAVLERVAAVSFGLGYLARLFLGVEV